MYNVLCLLTVTILSWIVRRTRAGVVVAVSTDITWCSILTGIASDTDMHWNTFSTSWVWCIIQWTRENTLCKLRDQWILSYNTTWALTSTVIPKDILSTRAGVVSVAVSTNITCCSILTGIASQTNVNWNTSITSRIRLITQRTRESTFWQKEKKSMIPGIHYHTCTIFSSKRSSTWTGVVSVAVITNITCCSILTGIIGDTDMHWNTTITSCVWFMA